MFGSGFNDEHPHEIAAHWLDGSAGEEKKVRMANVLVLSGYDPAESLAAVGLDPIAHTGLPSYQLQPVAQISPLDPAAAYADEVK
jgi:hypothetical protein